MDLFVDWTLSTTGLLGGNWANAPKLQVDNSAIGLAFNGIDLLHCNYTARDVEIKYATSPMELKIYNTYTDASNYERGFLKWDTNEFIIGTEAAGTGTARNLKLQTNDEFRVGDSSDDDEFVYVAGQSVRVGIQSSGGLHVWL